jgi:wobble nucleotide-excising tRNase
MGQSLTEIAQQLKDNNKKVQLIYAFNGVGKTRLSREFKELIAPKESEEEEREDSGVKVLYYNAFTEDLFYWDNDLDSDSERKLIIRPNNFTHWVLAVEGQENNIISNFQHYTSQSLIPRFNPDYSEVEFAINRGNDERIENVKISKGEESNFIWSVFYSFLEQIVEALNIAEPDERQTNQFDDLEYIFIDDPVSSLDENHLIELAVNVASLIKSSQSELQFIITTHNPLFYNVLHNELNGAQKYRLEKFEDGSYELQGQPNDSPFSYHLYLMSELERAIVSNDIHKYHFNFLRNILEKTATFLGYEKWGDLLPETSPGERDRYHARIINISSHSKHTGEEVSVVQDNDKRVLGYIFREVNRMYGFNSSIN